MRPMSATSKPLLGLFDDIPNSDYHASEGVSKSQLDLFRRSPYHYWSAFVDMSAPPRKESEAMKMGTLVHTAVLEPELLDLEYIVGEFKDKRTKAYKEAVKEAKSEGRILLTTPEMDLACRCRDAVHAHPWASSVLESGKAEVSMFAVDEVTGEKVRSRVDWLTPMGLMVDLKTTQDASQWGFAKSCRQFSYYLQAAMYLEVGRLCGLGEDYEFVFIAVERQHPYGVAVYKLDVASMANGHQTFRDLLDRYHECRVTDLWPCYSDELEMLSL